MKNILVVGVGNFGSWWVISLIKFKFPLKIYCFDNEPTKYSILKKDLIMIIHAHLKFMKFFI